MQGNNHVRKPTKKKEKLCCKNVPFLHASVLLCNVLVELLQQGSTNKLSGLWERLFFFLTKVVIAQTNQESASIIFEIRAYVYVMYNGENRYKDVSVFLS